MTDEHVDDPDPRGPDFDHPLRTIIQPVGSGGPIDPLDQYRSINLQPKECPVCGEIHKEADV